ncbi:hypothetical protein [Rahnella bonaserana]
MKVSVSQLHWAIKTDREYFGFSISVITYRAAPKPPKRGKCFSPFGFPLAVSTRASLAGYVSATIATGWKSCRFAVPSVRATTRAKRRTVLRLSSGGILEPASGFDFTTSLSLFFKMLRAIQKSC